MANTNNNVDAVIENIYKDVHPFLNERQKRILAGSILPKHAVLAV